MASGGLPWPSNVKVVEVVSMIAGESTGEDAAAVAVVAANDAGSGVLASTGGAAVAADCDEDSVLELECCCCSGLVSDILRVAV